MFPDIFFMMMNLKKKKKNSQMKLAKIALLCSSPKPGSTYKCIYFPSFNLQTLINYCRIKRSVWDCLVLLFEKKRLCLEQAHERL
jgi:hypothetical protein